MYTAALIAGLAAVANAQDWSSLAAWQGLPTTFPSNADAYCSAYSSSAAAATGSTVYVTTTVMASSCPTAAPTPSVPASYMAGFHNASVGYSANGSAICVTGDIPVAISAKGIQLNIPSPANQTALTELFLQLLQANATYPKQIMGGPSNITGTYTINSKLCYPKASSPNASMIEILTHGVGFAKSYWDFAPGYSYVDAAADAGHTTFFYDRLGVGDSAHPDPINVVQGAAEIAVLHELTQMLRAGSIASTTFSNIVGVGHSLGSILTVGQTSMYPNDLDAAVLTGYTSTTSGLASFTSALDLAIAAQNDPARFSGLQNGYAVDSNVIGNQWAFFRFPMFSQEILDAATAARQTVTIGELYTLGVAPTTAANFTGPVDIVDGENDWPFCDGNCLSPMDLAQSAIATTFPKAGAGSQSILLPSTGHGVNLHYTARDAYAQIDAFLAAHGY